MEQPPRRDNWACWQREMRQLRVTSRSEEAAYFWVYLPFWDAWVTDAWKRLRKQKVRLPAW